MEEDGEGIVINGTLENGGIGNPSLKGSDLFCGGDFLQSSEPCKVESGILRLTCEIGRFQIFTVGKKNREGNSFKIFQPNGIMRHVARFIQLDEPNLIPVLQVCFTDRNEPVPFPADRFRNSRDVIFCRGYFFGRYENFAEKIDLRRVKIAVTSP